MRGWILHKNANLPAEERTYELNRLLEEAEKADIDILAVRPEQLDLTVTREDNQSILLDGQPVELPHFIIPRMGAGTTYFALAVLRHLERLGVYSVNFSQSIDTVKDKLFTHQILAKDSLPVPKTMLVKFPVDVDLVEKHVGFPVVVKTLSGSQGSGVFLSESKRSFADLMKLIESTNRMANIILQEYVNTCPGRDLRVFTIGGRAVACMERTAVDGGFKTNFSLGGSVASYEITPEIEWLATQAAQLVNLDIAGVDLLFDGDHFKICEVNSSPGFKGIESCCDINVPKEIYHYVRIRLGVF